MNTGSHMEVQDVGDLSVLGAHLHDAVFGRTDLDWDRDKRVVTLHLWREGSEMKSKRLIRFLPFITSRRFKRVRCALRLYDVTDVIVSEKAALDHHCVTGFAHAFVDGRHRITVGTAGTMALCIVVEQLAGECKDTGDVTEEQFGFTTLGFGGGKAHNADGWPTFSNVGDR